jgi:WD40 repeat protein
VLTKPPASPLVRPLTSLRFQPRFQIGPESRFSPASFTLKFALSIGSPISSVQFSPDGETLAFADHKTVYICNESGTVIQLFDLPDSQTEIPPRCLRFSTDGRLLAVSSQPHSISVFSLFENRLLTVLSTHESEVTSLLFSVDSQSLFSADTDGFVLMWDLSSFQVVRHLREGVRSDRLAAANFVVSLAFSVLGLMVVYMSGLVTFCDLAVQDAPVKTANLDHNGLVIAAKMMPGQNRFGTVSQDGTVKIWGLNELVNCVGTLDGHKDIVVSVCFSPDEELAFTGSKDQTMRVWELGRHARAGMAIEGYRNTVFEIDHHPIRRRIVNCGADGHVTLWDYV